MGARPKGRTTDRKHAEALAPLADQMEALAHKLVEDLPDVIAGASCRQVMVALGLVIDWMLLLRREAPTQPRPPDPTDGERAARLAELVERFRHG